MPELRDLDIRELYSHARDLDNRLRDVCPRIPEDRRWTASLMLPRSAGNRSQACGDPARTIRARSMVSELKCMARAYLAELIR